MSSGRIYVPQEICRRHGWDESRFAAGQCDAAFRDLLQPLVDEADAMLSAGQPLVDKRRSDLRLPVRLFIGGGRAILAAIREAATMSGLRRPTVGRLTKLRLLATACLQSTWWRG